jgi:hypothetical protein
MATTRQWVVDIVIDEREDARVTHAEARLRTNGTAELVGRGTAHRHPDDAEVARIGDELATARALSNLSHELIHTAARDIEQITKQRVHLRR